MDAAGAWRQPQRPRGRYMRSSGVSREAFIANEERKSRSCAAFALAGGLALIIAGSVIMRRADYGHVKSHLVEEYNKGERLKLRVPSPVSPRSAPARIFPRQQRSDLTLRRTPPPLHSQLSTPGRPSTPKLSTRQRSRSSSGTPWYPRCSRTRLPPWTALGARATRTNPSRLRWRLCWKRWRFRTCRPRECSRTSYRRWERLRRTSGCPRAPPRARAGRMETATAPQLATTRVGETWTTPPTTRRTTPRRCSNTS